MTINATTPQGFTADKLLELTDEQIGTYTRAFVEHRADYMILDGWSKPWVLDDINQLNRLGLVKHDPVASERESDEQYTAIAYRPAPEFVAALRVRTAIARTGAE